MLILPLGISLFTNVWLYTSSWASKILALLTSEDLDVQIHAVKVVANLAAEGIKDILYNVSTQACPNRLMRLFNLLVVVLMFLIIKGSYSNFPPSSEFQVLVL